jgi:lipopolysaccharide/colanic/teichoic acid biosynthesis glycosyltransferase
MRTFRASAESAKAQPLSGVPLPAWKRTIDLLICCAALPAFAITTFFVAVLMSVTSPGPIFFRQERVGYKGRRFSLYKFRTMHVGADVSNHQLYSATLMSSNTPMLKLDSKGDKRLIPFGWLIRALGLDELPQMINVLRGEMSVVGPRPCIPYEYDRYSVSQRARFNAMPGITGLWQVSGKNRTTFDRMVQLDIEYGKRRSLLLDSNILLRTVPAVVTQVLDIVKTYHGRPKPCGPSSELLGQGQTLEISKNVPPVRAS